MEIKISDIIAVLAIIISVISFFLGFKKNKKLNAETEWHRTWASDFLNQANNYNRLVSQIVVGIEWWSRLDKDGEHVEAKKQNEEIRNNLYKLKLSKWELRKYSQLAPKGADYFCNTTNELFNLLSDLVAYCKDPKMGKSFSLEKIREAQFSYSKASREIHKELLGI